MTMPDSGPKISHTTGGRTRVDWDVRGILAILALLGGFTLAGASMLTVGTADIPAWAAATVSAVMGFYFGSRSQDGAR